MLKKTQNSVITLGSVILLVSLKSLSPNDGLLLRPIVATLVLLRKRRCSVFIPSDAARPRRRWSRSRPQGSSLTQGACLGI